MTKYTTVLGNVLRHLSRSDFETAISGYQADRRVRYFRAYDLFKSLLYGLITRCFSIREIEKSMTANSNRLYQAGLKQVKRSILLRICRTLDGIQATSHDLLVMLKTTLLTKNTLLGLCTNTAPPRQSVDASQLFLDGFLC
ncbi:MAG: DUF4372 domain-containing protein [Treponema sp.]|nr:DUF4372 domain-containing protein [Treponema sp.]